jgi:hypothetical protein
LVVTDPKKGDVVYKDAVILNEIPGLALIDEHKIGDSQEYVTVLVHVNSGAIISQFPIEMPMELIYALVKKFLGDLDWNISYNELFLERSWPHLEALAGEDGLEREIKKAIGGWRATGRWYGESYETTKEKLDLAGFPTRKGERLASTALEELRGSWLEQRLEEKGIQ